MHEISVFSQERCVSILKQIDVGNPKHMCHNVYVPLVQGLGEQKSRLINTYLEESLANRELHRLDYDSEIQNFVEKVKPMSFRKVTNALKNYEKSKNPRYKRRAKKVLLDKISDGYQAMKDNMVESYKFVDATHPAKKLKLESKSNSRQPFCSLSFLFIASLLVFPAIF